MQEQISRAEIGAGAPPAERPAVMHDASKPRTFFPWFLGGVMLLFIGIMIYVYQGAKEANPVMLDEHGRPRNAAVSRD